MVYCISSNVQWFIIESHGMNSMVNKYYDAMNVKYNYVDKVVR